MASLRGWGIAAALLAAATWGVPGEARAYPAEPYSLDEGLDAHSTRFQLLGELGMFFGNIEGGQRAVLMSPVFDLRLQLAEHWLLGATWGLAYVNLTQGEDQADNGNSFRAGNPFLAVHYQGVKGQFSYRFGVGVTIPVARLPDAGVTPENLTAASAYSLAAAIRGNVSFWLWDPHSISVILPMAFERRKPSGFIWGANFATGAMLQCCGDQKDRNTNQQTDPVIQMGALMGYQATDWLRVGSNFTLVIIPRLSDQKTQLAVQPYMRFGSEDAFGTVALTINLDRPNGFSFDKDQVWGVLVGGGGAF